MKFWNILALTGWLLASPVLSQDVNTFYRVHELVDDRFGNNDMKTIVRLAFHDAMGGVDGRLQESDSEHNGLLGVLGDLSDLYEDNQSDLDGLGRSDFFAWAYVSAFYHTVPGTPPWVPLTFGRADVGNGASEDKPPGGEFGSPDHSAVLSYFSSNFGFGEGDVAVILGAHTLGGADTGNSGFTGDWTDNPNRFDAEYYETMDDPPGGSDRWEQVEVGGKFQWQWGCGGGGGCRDLMLNVDMALLFEIDYDSTGRAILPSGSSCNSNRIFDDCFPLRTGGTGSTVLGFAGGGSDGNFRSQFAGVYARMIDRVKTSSSLTSISQPGDWPNGLGSLNGGGDGGGNNSGDNPDGGSSLCFSGSDTVEVQGQGRVPLKDVQIGEVVKTGPNQFEPVYAFGHLHATKSGEYLQIDTDGNNQAPLEMTGNHLIYSVDASSGDSKPIPAAELAVGDLVGVLSKSGEGTDVVTPSKVTKIKRATRKGLYMPLTPSGKIAVNGVVSSCYVSLEEELPPTVAKYASWFLSEATVLHWWLAPYRIADAMGLSSWIGGVDEQGYLQWLMYGKKLAEFAEDKGVVIQLGLIGLPLLLALGVVILLEAAVGAAAVPKLLFWLFVWLCCRKTLAERAGSEGKEKAWRQRKDLLSSQK